MSAVTARSRASSPSEGLSPEHAVGLQERQQPRGEVVDLEPADVHAVEPVELLEVEDRADRVDVGPGEALRELVEAEHLDVLALGALGRRVGQQREEVDQRLGQVALLLEPGEPGGGVLALGDLRLVGVAQQRHVGERRRGQAEPLVEQHVLGGRGDPLLAAHDVGDAHLVVVDDDGEVVGREAVGLEDHLVVGARRRHPAADQVVELERGVVGDRASARRASRRTRAARAAPPRSCRRRAGRSRWAAWPSAGPRASARAARSSTSSGRPCRRRAAARRRACRCRAARSAGRARTGRRRRGPRPR